MCVEGERRVRVRKGGGREKKEGGINTCTVLRWRMAQLLMAFMAAVAMVRVECGRGRGEEEWRGGPSCNNIAYSNCIRPGEGV